MKYRWLEQFIEIAEKESMSKAAVSLYIAQPTLSKNMKSLEKELDVLLFTRTKTGTALTEHGRAFLPYAIKMRDVFEAYEKEKERISDYHFDISCVVNFSLTPILFQTYYEDIRKELAAHFANINFMFMEFNKADAIAFIAENPNTFALAFSEHNAAVCKYDEIVAENLYKTPIATYTQKNIHASDLDGGLRNAIATSREYLAQYGPDVKLVTNNLDIIRHQLETDDSFFIALPQIIAAKQILPFLPKSVQSYELIKQDVNISLIYHQDTIFRPDFIRAVKAVLLKCLIS